MNKNISQDLVRILGKAVENKMYGSVEIFFEAGSVTQITQRIINKINRPKIDTKKPSISKKPLAKVDKNKSVSQSSEAITNSPLN